jgi:hypothetical protein
MQQQIVRPGGMQHPSLTNPSASHLSSVFESATGDTSAAEVPQWSPPSSTDLTIYRLQGELEYANKCAANYRGCWNVLDIDAKRMTTTIERLEKVNAILKKGLEETKGMLCDERAKLKEVRRLKRRKTTVSAATVSSETIGSAFGSSSGSTTATGTAPTATGPTTTADQSNDSISAPDMSCANSIKPPQEFNARIGRELFGYAGTQPT